MSLPPGVTKWGNWYFIELNTEEVAELLREVNGTGGFEGFLRRLQKQVNHSTRNIKLNEKDLADIPHYAFDFTQGGWEDRLIAIFGRALGPTLGRESTSK